MAFREFLRRLLQKRVATPEELAAMRVRSLEAKKRALDKRLEAIEKRVDLSWECQRLDLEASRLEAEFRRALRSAVEPAQGQRSRYWRCPHCETRLEKPSFDMVERLLETGADFSGTATCPKCGGDSSQAEVYGGRFDV
jgi:hypothetical protein